MIIIMIIIIITKCILIFFPCVCITMFHVSSTDQHCISKIGSYS